LETRPLGNTGYSITRIGFGTWALGGGDWVAGWGDQDDRASIAAILRTLERGINWIDTAPVYGLGRAEEVVARALAEWRGPRPYVFTKCSMVWDAAGIVRHSLKCDSVRRECEASLRRLRVDVLDLVQIHWPVHPVNQPAPDIEEGWTALAELQREGKIRHIGVSNFGVGTWSAAAESGRLRRTSRRTPSSAPGSRPTCCRTARSTVSRCWSTRRCSPAC